jgi:hypothetical protein
MAATLVVECLHCQICGYGCDPARPWIPQSIGKKPRRCAKCRSMRWDASKYPGAGPFSPTPTLRGRKASASDKRGRVGILLNPRPQLRLPLSIAAAVLLFFTLVFLIPSRLHASNSPSAVGVQGASPEDHYMPAKATLRRVVHRKPVPFRPYAHVPEYLLCHVTETLECGHTLEIFPQADPLIAVRRRCQECDGEQNPIAALKKPSGSVGIPSVRRERA